MSTEFIDPDTGEIIEAPRGKDALAKAARTVYRCNEEIKAWERIKAPYRELLAARQTEKTAHYDDVIVSIQQRVTSKLNNERWREVLEQHPLEADDIWTLAVSATGFANLPEHLEPLVALATEHKVSNPYPVVNRGAKPAPGMER